MEPPAQTVRGRGTRAPAEPHRDLGQQWSPAESQPESLMNGWWLLPAPGSLPATQKLALEKVLLQVECPQGTPRCVCASVDGAHSGHQQASGGVR